MRRILLILCLMLSSIALSQNELRAQNYFEKGEYKKALITYTKLYKQSSSRLEYLMAMVECNQQLEQFDEAEKLLQEKLKGKRKMPQLWVELGYNFSLQQKDSLATVNYKRAIDDIDENHSYAYQIGKTFQKYALLDEATTSYEKAMKLNPEKDYNSQLARIYGEQGKLKEMFEKYINLINKRPIYKSTAQRNFSSFVNENPNNEANKTLRKVLLRKIQDHPNILYNDLLSWLFIQQKEYKKAFIQEKAIYNRMEDQDVESIIELAFIAMADEDYESATKIVNFVIEEAATPEQELDGKQYLMNIALKTAKKADYDEIEKKFEALLDEYGRGRNTYRLQLDYNYFLAFQHDKKDKAIENLKSLLKKRMTQYQEARIKMKLADILVFDEKFNEALIYYSQIQKKIKGDILAQEARYKVAKTSYYKGDFVWAKIQLDVLKRSTSQLIANDAMQLSFIIQDNSVEDSTQTALKKFAHADLLALQKKDKEAIQELNVILEEHKGEKIEDEVLLKLGELYEAIGFYEKAEESYSKLIEFYKEDILADDAHFKLAKLYETKLNDVAKAQELYELIIFNYSDSIFFVEARKRFRMLRGDEIN